MVALALLALMAAKPAPPPLVPTGPWYVRAEESMCLLERRYEVKGSTISLVFQPLLDLPTMEVFVIDPESGGGQQLGVFSASTQSAPHPYAGNYFSVMAKGNTRVTRLSVDRRMLDGLKDGDALHIKAKPVDLTFSVVRPEKARETLQACTNQLKKDWGIDPDTLGRAVTPLEGNPARFFSPESYPIEARRKGIYGRVIALLNIDATGAVSNCRIVSSAGQDLNEGTCKAAARIRFKPPVDKAGQPLPSTYLLPVRWTLGNGIF